MAVAEHLRGILLGIVHRNVDRIALGVGDKLIHGVDKSLVRSY